MTSATESWKRQLQEWVIPQQLIDAVSESPYGWSAPLWRRRASEAAESGSHTPTTERVLELAGPDGDVLDVGAGTGRASLPIARQGHRVTAVEPDSKMLEGLRELSRDLPVTVVEGSWPEAAAVVKPHYVVLSAHVVYDVADIGPFLAALMAKARAGVVIEMTERHPWVHLGPYYKVLHDLDRPSGPTTDDLVDVVREVLALEPVVERWDRPSDLWFESIGEMVGFYGRRIVLPENRWPELKKLLEPEIIERDGRFQVGLPRRQLATIWWSTVIGPA